MAVEGGVLRELEFGAPQVRVDEIAQRASQNSPGFLAGQTMLKMQPFLGTEHWNVYLSRLFPVQIGKFPARESVPYFIHFAPKTHDAGEGEHPSTVGVVER